MGAITVTCPECGHQLHVTDRRLIGRAARCPKCRHKFKLDKEKRTRPRSKTPHDGQTTLPQAIDRYSSNDSIPVACPSCTFVLQIHDPRLLGRSARCPECARKFVLGEMPASQQPKSPRLERPRPEPEQAESAETDVSSYDRETFQGNRLPPVAEAPHDSNLQALEPLGRYRILRELGQGTMGTVYLARDSQLDREVALKVPKFPKQGAEELLERFYREARSAAKLRHPNICPVFDVGEVNGRHYLTMACIKGRVLPTDRRFSENRIVDIIRKLALALDHAHSEEVVHRDLKPANIMIDQHNEPMIMDFGLARPVVNKRNVRLTQSGIVMGTPAYMSPEQARGEWETIGPRSDVYSLGAVLYELLTGQIPFEGPAVRVLGKVLNDEPERPRQINADCDPRLEEICLKMMAKRPEDRFSSMRAVVDALTTWRREKRNARTWSISNRSKMLGTAAALTVLASGLVWMIMKIVL